MNECVAYFKLHKNMLQFLNFQIIDQANKIKTQAKGIGSVIGEVQIQHQ